MKKLPLILILAISMATAAAEGAQVTQHATPEVHGTEHDFDFLAGSWKVHSRRLLHPLSGSQEWIEFEGTNVSRPLWNGRGNIDEFEAAAPTGPMQGLTLRLFDAATRQWRIYWANGAKSTVDMPPMVGGFEKGHGEFYDCEELNGKPIMVRFLWTSKSPGEARWEQAFSADDGKTWETNWTWDLTRDAAAAIDPHTQYPAGAFKVLELRRYTLVNGARPRFAEYFDSFFPEAMQQLGAIAAGDFLNRENPAMFTWIRGYHDMDERARVNASFYYGPVWKEHRTAANGMMVDSDNVLLLRPVSDKHPLLILPALDPTIEPNGARGVALGLVFAVKPEQLEAFIGSAETALGAYPAEVREAGMFVTLDERNNFPQLPVRTDGPFVVWLGLVRDDAALARVDSVTKQITESLNASGALRSAPEVMLMDPSRRSRLRWLP
jgi:hypothetical protein